MYLPEPVELVEQAIRSGGTQRVELDARRGGALIAQGLPVLDGQVVDRPSTGGVRRTTTVEIEDLRGLWWDTLSPAGTTLHPTTVLETTNGAQLRFPHGVFDVDAQSAGIGPEGGLQLTCPDWWARVQRAKALSPLWCAPGAVGVQVIADLIRGGLGANVPVLIQSTSQTTLPGSVWDVDRAAVIEEIAGTCGVHVSFDRLGRCVIADLPVLTTGPVWTVDAGRSGVLLGGKRERTRRGTANVVVVTCEDKVDAYGPGFGRVVVWDSDTASPTYAGPDPINRPDLAGPFGVVPYPYSSPLLTDQAAAERAARTILARTTGLASSVDIDSARHPGLDAYDVFDLLPPRRAPGVAMTVERHIADAVTHPLGVSGRQAIAGRSTRTDEFQ